MEYLVTAPIKDNIYYIGTNDRQTEKFEGMWPLPNGVAYNSFLIKGEKNIIVDLVKINTISVYIEKIKEMAENDDRSFSQYVNMVLKEYISKENRTKRNDN